MRSYVAAFVLAMVVAALLTPLVRRLALRLDAVSRPGGRNVHGASVPRLGGVGIAVAALAPLVALFFVDSGVAEGIGKRPLLPMGLLMGGLVMCLVGVVDDTRGLRAAYKLTAQVAVATLAFGLGFRIDAITLPLVGALHMGVFALPVTLLWIVGVTNAINLIDGLDGLAAGVVFFAAVTNFVVAIIHGTVLVALLMSAIMGALIGFLFYNFNPARIFMGDSGSYFLGFVLASTALAGASQKASTAVALLVPVVALGVPIFDTLFSMVRRILERRPVFAPDRGHIHHRLLDMGITHRRAVLILYGVSIAFTAAAIGISLGRSWEVGLALLGATVVMLGLVRFVGYFEYLHLRRRQKARLYDRHTERMRRQVPPLIAALGAARDEDELWARLEAFARLAELSAVEVLQREGNGEKQLRRLVTGGAERERDLVSARFPIGRDAAARAWLKFTWRSDTEDVPPHADILLQVTTDAVEKALGRLGSELAPVPSAEDEAVGADDPSALARSVRP